MHLANNKLEPTILIVDDMQSNIAVLSEFLKQSYNLKVAKNGKRALEVVQQGGIDLVLLDVLMPEMDGYEVCQALSDNPQTKHIPIIFITGSTSVEDEKRGFHLGAVDYIAKPFHASIVLARVKVHIQLKQKREELFRKNEKLKEYIQLVDENVITSSTDLDGNITYVSQAFCDISGYSKEELLGKNHRIVRHPDFNEKVYEELWETVVAGKTWEGEIKNLKKDGGHYWVQAKIYPIYEQQQRVGYTAIRQDITDKKRVEEISITDGLTRIFNRRHFNETFPKTLERGKRDDTLVCFLLMDIDHFKQYNDNYGHQMGDDVLKAFATCLKEILKEADDRAFRLGGEEFGIVYKAESKEKAFAFAQSVRESIESLKIPHEHNSASKYITASMGLVCKSAEETKDMDTIYKEADDLLYDSKKSGRNRVKMS